MGNAKAHFSPTKRIMNLKKIVNIYCVYTGILNEMRKTKDDILQMCISYSDHKADFASMALA